MELECDCHRLVISVFFCHIEAVVSVTDKCYLTLQPRILTPTPNKNVLTATNSSCGDNTISKIAHYSRT